MAIHIDLNTALGAKKIESIMLGRTEKLMKMATVEFFRQVVIATPVDTGRARFGWYITLNAPSTEVPPEGKYTMPSAAKHSAVGDYYTVKDVLYITNNVPYIGDLNNGSSKQAPARFVENAAERVQNAVSRLTRDIP